jgi:hypothetical protein
MQEKNSIEQLKSIVAERDKQIKNLEEQLEQLQENVSVAQMTSNQQFFLKNPIPNEPTENNNNNYLNGNSENEFLKQNSLSHISTTSRSNLNNNNQNSSVKTRPDSATLVERETISSR